MDFDVFNELAAEAYPESCPYTLEECLEIFRYFFQRYEQFSGQSHPMLKTDQINRIIRKMPFLNEIELDPDSYPVMIDKYFHTAFLNCDYRINHFFSGKIRELRFYEELY